MIKKRFQLGAYELLVFQVLEHSYQTFNYLLCREGKAVLIDAGEAKPILEILEQENLQLIEVLITHTHNDHTGGCRELVDRLGVQSTSPSVQTFEKKILETTCCSIFTPGHLPMHKCYFFPELNIVFTGDTIINGAVGRMMGGTADQYLEGLKRLCELPDETRVFGGHDYLRDNLEFALSVEPDHAEVKKRLALYESDVYGAVFQTMAEEKKTNLFLNTDFPDEFADLRAKKDRY